MFRSRGRGLGAIIGLLWLIVQTPWIAYVFSVLLGYCLLSAFLEQRRVIGVVQITIAVCLQVVYMFRYAQGYGWEYWMIWLFGLIGCGVYWFERQVDSSPLNDLR